MDGIAEKFSVFDFFNHVLSGTVFFAALFPLVSDWLIPIGTIADTLNEYDTPLQVFGIFLFFLAAFAAAMVLDTLSQGICALCAHLAKRGKNPSFISPIFDYNRYLMSNCLRDPSIVGNSQKLAIYQEKAKQYFSDATPTKMKPSTRRTQVRTECFFAHCLYYIQIRGQGQKAEHMRDVMGLSRLLSCSFFWTTLFALVRFVFLSGDLRVCMVCFAAYAASAFLFSLKYHNDALSRVRIILGIYDACVEQEKKKIY